MGRASFGAQMLGVYGLVLGRSAARSPGRWRSFQPLTRPVIPASSQSVRLGLVVSPASGRRDGALPWVPARNNNTTFRNEHFEVWWVMVSAAQGLCGGSDLGMVAYLSRSLNRRV